jgi:transcriptional antiterminator NusG
MPDDLPNADVEHDPHAGATVEHPTAAAEGAAPEVDEPIPAAGEGKPPSEPPTATAGDEAPVPDEEPPVPNNKRWYVVKVQSGREETIKEAIERRVRIEGLEEFYGQIVIPVERVTEMKKARDGSTKRVVREHKLYPGYVMAEVEYNDRVLYLFRETSGVGDFVGGTLNRPPTPMSQREIDKMLGQQLGPDKQEVKVGAPPFAVGDRVRVRDGTFAGMEGETKEVMEAVGHVKVELTIFGRPVPVELEYWQVEEA